MAKYGLSLSERKQAFLEDCCGGGGGGMDMSSDGGGDGADAFGGDSDPRDEASGLDKALDKLRRKRKKGKSNGS